MPGALARSPMETHLLLLLLLRMMPGVRCRRRPAAEPLEHALIPLHIHIQRPSATNRISPATKASPPPPPPPPYRADQSKRCREARRRRERIRSKKRAAARLREILIRPGDAIGNKNMCTAIVLAPGENLGISAKSATFFPALT